MIYRYVRHEHVLDYLKLGWHIATVDIGYHSRYSILMVWLCQCEAKEPRK